MMIRKRIILSTLGVAAAITFLLSQTAGSNRQYQLGGAWVGVGGGSIWTALHTPLDPEGRTMAGRVHFTTYNAGIAGLLTSLGGDTMSDFVGQTQMTSRDTAKWSLVGYVIKQGNPPVIQGITVGQGTWRYTSNDSAVLNYTYYVYLPSADANGDGLPDAGTTPAMTFPDLVDTAQRVLPPAN